jgi:carbamoylphosphate synthase small subunit
VFDVTFFHKKGLICAKNSKVDDVLITFVPESLLLLHGMKFVTDLLFKPHASLFFKKVLWLFQMEIKSNVNTHRKERRKVAVIDFGDSVNVTRYLMEIGYMARVFPVSVYDEIDRWNADGLVLSDGPGNPNAVFQYAAEVIKDIKLSRTPVFGIGLGHQLMALAEGFLVSRRDAKYQCLAQPIKNLKRVS